VSERSPAVLVLCDTVAHDGGTESYLSRVLPGLRDRGLEVRIAARRVLDANAFGVPATEIRWGADDAPAEREAAREIRALIRSTRPDVVITSNVHDAEAMAAARSAPQLVVRVHDHRIFCPQGDRQFPHFPAACTQAMGATACVSNAVLRGCVAGINLRTLELLRSRQALQSAALRADHFIVSSQFMAGICRHNGVSAAQLRVFPPPFGGEISRAPRPARDRVLFAGRLVRDKGLASLVRAVAKISPGRRPALSVAGAMTTELQSLPALATRLGVAMSLLGKLGAAELCAEIDASTLVAVPSLWPEPFGLMGIEAQARGRPVVAYDVGSISEWMGSAGVLVPRADERALGKAIETILEPARWLEYSDAALRQVQAYGIDAHVDSLLVLIAQRRPLAGAI